MDSNASKYDLNSISGNSYMGSKILLVDDRKPTGEADVKGWIFSKSTCKCKDFRVLGFGWGVGFSTIYLTYCTEKASKYQFFLFHGPH